MRVLPARKTRNPARRACLSAEGPGNGGFRAATLAAPWSLLAALFILVAAPAHGHLTGSPLPIGYAGQGSARLAAQVAASYFQEQMGRETELVPLTSAALCLEAVRKREFPMAVVPGTVRVGLPEGLQILDGFLGAPGRTFVLVMGSDARKKLEFSLVQRYMDTLTKKLGPEDWERAEDRVRKGEGVRGVALDILKEKDLL